MMGLLNTRVLMSVGMIAVTGGILISSTGAFFSDSETSVANVFTSGTLEIDVNGNLLTPLITAFNDTGVMPGSITTHNVNLKVIGGDAWIKTVITPSVTTPADIALAGFIDNSAYYSVDNGANWVRILGVSGPTIANAEQGKLHWNTATGVVTYYHGASLTPAQQVTLRINTCIGTMSNDTDTNPLDDMCDGTPVLNTAQGGTVTSEVSYTAMQSVNNAWSAF